MQSEDLNVRLGKFRCEGISGAPGEAVIATKRVAVGDDEGSGHRMCPGGTFDSSPAFQRGMKQRPETAEPPGRLSPHVFFSFYARATSSRTSPLGLISWMRSGICPHACVEQLRQGS